ncbi:MAG: N-6 DNA methylase [Candidatus Hydrothermarchaeota archaeon]|nr:N-6 DNA methylase [Candidatus Hydrothermarchaeota archaeon]
MAWGVLTDGKLWRLYYRERNPVDSYYEVDLGEILKSGSKSDFKYFYLFFRKEAFLKDATGKNFLEKVYSEGVDYAKKVSEDLEKNIYRALKILAQGFLAWKANNLKPTEEAVKEIHKNSLIFLYRILFILYAESRGLLKIYKPGYEYYDIAKIKVVAFYKKPEGSASEHSLELWIRLKELFKLIDEGSESRKIPKEELYVPSYNGELFRQDGDYKFLSENSVGDKYVADVLSLLTFSEEEGDKGFIDYSTLEIRHLGSIYEGLLEYKLKVAEEDLVAVKEKDKQIWISENKANGKKILDEAKKGELYLATDKGERKATGSYYTPNYIVKYIVENTLLPIVEEKLKGASTGEEKIERILSTKVLDPAMGSGHFLVEATNFLAFLAEQMIEMNKQENGEIKCFVGWLELEIGAKVDDLSNKTTIREYYNNSFEDLVKTLKKNKSKLGIDPSRREFQEKVKSEFDSSVSKLTPLMQKIELTDKLIDQIVYKLYGLAEGEIKLVEGAR